LKTKETKETELKKIELTVGDFLFADKILKSLGYHETSEVDSKYEYTNNGYTIRVQISFLKKEQKWEDNGRSMARIMIFERGVEKYCTKPLQGLSDFVWTLLRYAWVTRWKVNHRHHCPECRAFMNIQKKENTRQYMYICDKNEDHSTGEAVFYSWDHGLPLKAKEFLKIQRQATA
jgi:hypothetical protein